jgi:integral membrane sensor domain MASE1
MILFTLWFGAYGAIAAYVGTLLAGVLTTESLLQHPEIAVIWAAAGPLQALIPLVAVRTFDVDLTLESRRDWTIILLFGILINNLIGAAWGAFTLSLLPGTTMNIAGAFSTWLVGNIIVTILIVPLALRFCTGRVRQSKLFVKQYWD